MNKNLKITADDANDNQLLNLPQNSGSSVSSPPPDENLVVGKSKVFHYFHYNVKTLFYKH